MITGIRIDSVEAAREKNDDIVGLDVNIGIDEIKVNSNQIEIKFNYQVSYKEKIGYLKMKGVIYTQEEAKKAKEIEKSWTEQKRLPDDFSEMILNAINFTCGTNGVLVVRPVNLAPPMMPPKIQLKKE
ncbi:MAG: hypothetical protein N3D10_00125 [Candidatus Micrarchaeota archaeon]|nr:hypothetical protein [Candidatus Micrarchaeota archaeon]